MSVLGIVILMAGLIAGPRLGDPTHAMLLAVPGTALALFGMARDLGVAGRIGAHGVVAIALTTATLSTSRFGIDGIATLFAGAWLMLLGHAVAMLLGPIGRRFLRPRPIGLHAFTLPLIVYLAVASWGLGVRPPDGDEPYNLLLAHSLITDADVDLSDEYQDDSGRRFIDRTLEPQPGDPRGPDGELFSRHNFFLPLLLGPFYALGGRAGAAILIAILAAMTVWITAGTARRIVDLGADRPGKGRAAFLLWMLLAFTPPLLLFSHQIWVEVPAALALAVSVDRLWRLRMRWRNRDVAIVAAGAVALVALKIRFALIAVSLVVLVAFAFRRHLQSTPDDRSASLLRRYGPMVLGVGLLSALAIGALLMRNHLRFGNALRMHELGEMAIFDRPLMSFFLGAGGLFFDCAFGLFAAAPVWLLLVPALIAAMLDRAGPGRLLLADVAFLGLPYLFVLAPRLEWYGGWSPPFRYAVALLPVLALAMLPLLAMRRAGLRVVGSGLVLVTLLLTTLWLVVPGWTYNLADGGNHLIDGASARQGVDLGRFFPSMVRPRLASWLWPLMVVMLAPLVFLGRGRRQAVRHRWSGMAWGSVLALVFVAALPIVAARVPTRTVELEDGQVRARGGHVSPRPWTTERPRYRGGWTLRAGQEVQAPINGAGAVRLRLSVRFILHAPERPLELEILADDRPLKRIPASSHQVWQVFDIDDVVWPTGADLVVRAVGERRSREDARDPERGANGVIVDYVDFYWQQRPASQ